MNGNDRANRPSQEVETYEIRLEGLLSDEWSDWFDGVAIAPDGRGGTVLTCRVADQAALHGVLRKVRDLGLRLLSIDRIEPRERGDGK